MLRLLVLALALIATLPGRARAHQSSVKYVDITVDGARAEIALTVAPSDVTEPLGLAADARPRLDDALTPAVARYVAGWLAVADATGARCAPGLAHAAPDPDRAFVVVAWTATCAAPIDALALDLAGFFAVDPRHEAIVSVHAPGAPAAPTVVGATTPTVVLGVHSPPSVVAWIAHGMDHIYGGLDHVAFVLALLLVVVLRRDRHGWQVQRPGAALRATAVIVTAFTVAHSLSLIAASLGWVALPARLVESVIAASIVYTAIENVVRPDVRWRFGLTCAFGLIHGLGFASMLEALLPPTGILVPLLTFNLGVELGQLTIVVVALPLLWALARGLGADAYRRYVLGGAGGVLAAIGLKWLVERVLDVTTFTVWGM